MRKGLGLKSPFAGAEGSCEVWEGIEDFGCPQKGENTYKSDLRVWEETHNLSSSEEDA